MVAYETLNDFVETLPWELQGCEKIHVISKSLSGKMPPVWPYYYVPRRHTNLH